jgi:hypothetical protein
VATPGTARTACRFGPNLLGRSPLDRVIEIAEERIEGAGGAGLVDESLSARISRTISLSGRM